MFRSRESERFSNNVTDSTDITNLVDETIDEFGHLDRLVTNAGGPPSGKFLQTSEEDWYDAFDLLVMSVVRLVQETVDPLKESDNGTIVNITSRSVKEAINSLVLSNSVRMSVVGLEKTLSKELAPDIRANAVLPAPHETSRIKDLVAQGVERGEYESMEAGLEQRGANNPMSRIGQHKKRPSHERLDFRQRILSFLTQGTGRAEYWSCFMTAWSFALSL